MGTYKGKKKKTKIHLIRNSETPKAKKKRHYIKTMIARMSCSQTIEVRMRY